MRYIPLILNLILVAGCGSQGPLYLPEEEPVKNLPAAQAPATQGKETAEEEKDDQP